MSVRSITVTNLDTAVQKWKQLEQTRKDYICAVVNNAISHGLEETFVHFQQPDLPKEMTLGILEKIAKELGFLTKYSSRGDDICLYGWAGNHCSYDINNK